MKFRPNLPMYPGPDDEGHPEDADTPRRQNQPVAVDTLGVSIEPGDRVIEYDGETLTIGPVPEETEEP